MDCILPPSSLSLSLLSVRTDSVNSLFVLPAGGNKGLCSRPKSSSSSSKRRRNGDENENAPSKCKRASSHLLCNRDWFTRADDSAEQKSKHCQSRNILEALGSAYSLLSSYCLSSTVFFANDARRFEPFGTISPGPPFSVTGLLYLYLLLKCTALEMVNPWFLTARPTVAASSSLSKRVKSCECHQPKCSLILPIGQAFRQQNLAAFNPG